MVTLLQHAPDSVKAVGLIAFIGGTGALAARLFTLMNPAAGAVYGLSSVIALFVLTILSYQAVKDFNKAATLAVLITASSFATTACFIVMRASSLTFLGGLCITISSVAATIFGMDLTGDNLF